MEINTYELIMDNLSSIKNLLDDKKSVQCVSDKKYVYVCSPIYLGGKLTKTYISKGILQLESRVDDNSQGLIRYVEEEKINFNDSTRVKSDTSCGQMVVNKLFENFDTMIVKIWNPETQKFLKKQSNIEWIVNTSKYKIFTTLIEAESYIEKMQFENDKKVNSSKI